MGQLSRIAKTKPTHHKLMGPMKILFAGTPLFAAHALEALLAAQASAGFQVIGAYTQPDRPAHRGNKLTPSAVKTLALAHNVPVFQPQTLRNADAQAELAALNPDLMIVAAYGLILPQAVLDIPRLGCLNIHGSILPRWRGAAPIHRAIEAGDSETGVGIMRMEAGLDTGAVLYELRTPIADADTTGILHDRLAQLGAQAIVHVTRGLARGEIFTETPQPSEGITYAHKIKTEEAKIDWHLPAAQIARKIRAFNPNPGCSGEIAGELVKIWEARVLDAKAGVAGALLRADKTGLVIACGEGALEIVTLQKPGKNRVAGAVYASGRGGLSV
jgi:methionyl-tRNA formyltransferase